MLILQCQDAVFNAFLFMKTSFLQGFLDNEFVLVLMDRTK